MDPYALAKLGNVTIQRIPPKPSDAADTPVISAKEIVDEPVQNDVSQILQLPKLPSSINITVKRNPTSSSVSGSQPNIPKSSNVELEDEFEPAHGISPRSCSETDDHDDLLQSVQKNASITIESVRPQDSDESYQEEEEEIKSVDEYQEEEEKTDGGHSSPLDSSDVNMCDIGETPELEQSPGYEDENDPELFNSPDNSAQKMELENSPAEDYHESELDPELDTHPITPTENEEKLEGEVKEELSEFSDPQLDNEGVYDEDESVPLESDEIPEIPVDELLTEELICKDDQFLNQEADDESEDADDEFDNENADGSEPKAPTKKKKRKPKPDDESDSGTNESKKQKTIEGAEKSAGEIKSSAMRKNIREVMDETKLDEATLAAQRQEMERLRRVQEQQRIIREVQRQFAQNKQNSKMQARVLSLLQKGSASIVKKEEETVEEKKPDTVVIKLSSGSGPPQTVLEMLKKQNSTSDEEDDSTKEKYVNLSKNLDKPQMMTASVSIAPVKQETKSIEIVNEDSEDKTKSKDVVMISSSSDDEDDCIVISEEEDEESEPEEDTTNSGMHTNDLYNVPDDQGRVLINVGHPEVDKDVFLAPQIARIIKPHQIGGVRFLFDNIVESLSRYKTSEGFGCILAHSMGLGKTLQVISFCDVFLRYTESRTVLCIMPINTLQNWVAEFNMWLPIDPDNSQLREQGEVLPRQFPLFVLNDNHRTLSARTNVIQNWHKDGGVLLIGYELYRQLSLKKPPKSRNRSKRKYEMDEDYEDEKSKTLLETVHNALVKPGPDLVICDEGHRIKNSHASISQALKQIRSKRRVVLTGYPLQNNLLEYWCMVDFVRPNYLGTKTEFSNMFERPIQNGQCIDSTPQDIKLMRYRAHVLHSLLEGFVQRRSHSVLQQTLPSKYEYVLLLRLTPFQRKLYNTFMNEVVRTKAVPNPLKAFAVCCKIWNHPDILYNFLKKRAGDEELDLDIEDTSTTIGTPASGPSTPMTPSTPPQQTKRGRGRGSGNKSRLRKDDKLPRKNARISTPQPINKTPSIAAVPPNTASSKPLLPEQAISRTNNQPIPSFNSYNEPYQNYNQQNENYSGSYAQTGNSAQNYNNQYSQEYGTQTSTGTSNQEYANVNYQQNFGTDNNFYQSEYNQGNFWSGSNESNSGNFYNSSSSSGSSNSGGRANNSSATNDNFYQQGSASSASNSQFTQNEYNSNEMRQQGYSDNNFDFNVNSQMNYSGEFNLKTEPESLQNFGMSESDANEILMSDVNNSELRGSGFTDIPHGELNYGSNNRIGSMTGTSSGLCDPNNFNNRTMTNSSNSLKSSTAVKSRMLADMQQSGRSMAHNVKGRVPLGGSGNACVSGNEFSSMTTPLGQSRRGRPPANADMQGRPRKNANFRMNQGMVPGKEMPQFKPGLPGGSPVLKSGMPEDNQNFQNIESLNNQLNAGEINTYAQGQPGTSFLDSLRSDELWNPAAAEQNAIFTEQNYMYDGNGQGQSFLPGETPSLLGGVRASRSLLNEIQNNNEPLFNSSAQSNYSQNTPAPVDHNLFNLDNINYLNELQNANYQMSSHTSFMGLLEGDDSFGMGQSTLSSDMPLKNTSFNAQSAANVQSASSGNYMDGALQYASSELASKAVAERNTDKKASYGVSGQANEISALPVKKNVIESGVSLRSSGGQVSLGVAEKKAESQLQIPEGSTIGSKHAKPVKTLPEGSSQNMFQDPNRLPSINVFNTSQNFIGGAGLGQEAGKYKSVTQFEYNDAQTGSNSASTNTPNWDSLDTHAGDSAKANRYNGKKYNFDQDSAGTSNDVQDFARNSSECQTEVSFGTAAVNSKKSSVNADVKRYPPGQYQNVESKNFEKESQGVQSSLSATAKQESLTAEELKNRFLSNQSVSLIKVGEPRKNSEETSKSLFPPTKLSQFDTEQGMGNKSKPGVSSVSPVTSAKLSDMQQQQLQLQQIRRNVSMGSRIDVARQGTPGGDVLQNQNLGTRSTQAEIPQFSPTVSVMSVSAKSDLLGKDSVKSIKEEPDLDMKMPAPDIPVTKSGKEEPGIPYEWTNEFFKDYTPGKIEASAKTLIFFCMLEEIVLMGDRILLFSQSLFTLDLIEDFLHLCNIPNTEEKWARNKSYFRLDGSTTALEREKLINEFNSNPSVHLFLVSTRAGSLGINLVGANRVVVFDASWNPCHDTQAVCRVYRYGQRKSCYVYRFVMDNCLEKKIYDRQINKQGMSDRVVDECNPDAHLTIKDVSNLCWDSEDVDDGKADYSELKDDYQDSVIQKVIENFGPFLSKEPFQHESLLVDRKDKKLSQAEKRMAKRSYELEKQATLRPTYGFYSPHMMQNRMGKPMASVRPMQVDTPPARDSTRRWIPAEVWQKQGMSAQEMTLPLDVVIPTNASDSRSSIVLKAGQKVMVLKSPKGIYMQLENGKIIAIKTALKAGIGNGKQGPAVTAPSVGSMAGNVLSGSMGSGVQMTPNMRTSSAPMKMLTRPPSDRNLTSLGTRRDVTVSPIRNRFGVRTSSMPTPALRSPYPRPGRPSQPIVRTFPLARPQVRPSRPPLPAAGQQIFGPNSSVTISLANKRAAAENQGRIPIEPDLPMMNPGGMQRSIRYDDRMKPMRKDSMSHLTEVNYEDYNSINRLKEMQHSSQMSRRIEDEPDKRSQYEYQGINDGVNSRMINPSANYPPGRVSHQQMDPPSKSNTLQAAARYTDSNNSKLSNYSNVIPESLRYKKDINLTPVNAEASSKESADKATLPLPKASVQQQQMQNFQASQVQRLSQPVPKVSPAHGTNAGPGKKDVGAPLPRGNRNMKPEVPSASVQGNVVPKKDLTGGKNSNVPAKLSNQHSISIFPVNKKPEGETSPSGSDVGHQKPFAFEREGVQNASYQSKGNYYPEYQKPYYPENKQVPKQFGSPYDTYGQNFSANYPQQPEYTASQPQHSYNATQYTSAPYSGQEYRSTASASSYSGGDDMQFSNRTSFPGQPPAASASGSFGSYDQFGSYYNAQSYQQSPSKVSESPQPPQPAP